MSRPSSDPVQAPSPPGKARTAGQAPLFDAAVSDGDRRKEPRYPTNEPVDVEILRALSHTSGVILDVSRSGLSLQLDSAVGRGAHIKIKFPKRLIIFGEVRYCRKTGTRYHAGALIETLLFTHKPDDEHISDDELRLYVAGKGLSVFELINVTWHLENCETCRGRFAGPDGLQSAPP